MKLGERTFGLELENVNMEKAEVSMMNGASWSPDEMWLINTDKTSATPSAKRGGEINTRPLGFNKKDLRELRDFIKHIYDIGGTHTFYNAYDCHVYIGDFNLEELKKIVLLNLVAQKHFEKIMDWVEWMALDNGAPPLSAEIYERVKNTETLEAYANCFANSSIRGHMRYRLNTMPFFKTKTLEFRSYSATSDFNKILNAIKFTMRLADYAKNHNEQEIKKLENFNHFKKELKIRKNTEFAKYAPVLIWARDHKDLTGYVGKAMPMGKKILSAVATASSDDLATVHPFNYQAELALYSHKKLTIYNNSEYNHIIYRLATESEFFITYSERFDVLNEYRDGTRSTELCLFFIFSRIRKYNLDTDYGAREFVAYVNVINDSIKKIEPTALELVKMFASVNYKVATLFDALENHETVFYQQEKDSKASATASALAKFSDYEFEWESTSIDYDLVKEKTKNRLLIASQNKFLPYEKVAIDGSNFLYSNEKIYAGVKKQIKEQKTFTVKTPDDDFTINRDTKIKLEEVTGAYFYTLQQKFVKKVSKFKVPKFCYAIYSEDILLGAFGFDYPKDQNYDLFLLSDFGTNPNVKQLSKLILLIIRSKDVKKLVERKIHERLSFGYTKVYTTRPVSMKYRGAFKKVKKDDPKSLCYEFEFGSVESIQHAINEYIKRIK